MTVRVVVGTIKGAFVLEADSKREDWKVTGPIFKGWKVSASGKSADGEFFLGTASYVYGAAIQRSHNLEDWKQVEKGPAFQEGELSKLDQIWRIECSQDTFYAGVADAGLFASTDGGSNWEPVDSLNHHASRPNWMPGNGGLCTHTLQVDTHVKDRLYCGISAVGLFRSDNAGASWDTKNSGVKIILEDKDFKDIGYCVHAVAQDPDNSALLWRQEHTGMFRSQDAGESWQEIQTGLPSTFGFPICLDNHSRWLYSFPLESDEYRMPAEGAFKVYRSKDSGESWHALSKGLPQYSYAGVLRRSMAVDHMPSGGIYVGDTSGRVHYSIDGGDEWQSMPQVFPRILSVDAYVD